MTESNEGAWLLGGEDGEQEDGELQELVEWTTREKIVAAAAVVSAGASIASMLITDSIFISIFGILGVVVPIFSAFQEQKITEIEAMVETREVLTKDLEKFEKANAQLVEQEEKLNGLASRVEELSSVMSEIKDKESASLDLLEESLENSKAIMKRLGKKRLTAIVNNIFDIALTCDTDGNMSLSDDEIDKVIVSIEGIQGLDINNDDLKEKIIARGRGIDSLMDIIKLAFDSNPDNDPLDGEGEDLFQERAGLIEFRQSLQ